MNVLRMPPAQVPTLTEVVDLQADGNDEGDTGDAPLREGGAPVAVPGLAADAFPPIAGPSAEQLTQSVLHDVQRQVDLMLEYRLRESLTPVLSRVADALVKDLRQELTATLRDIVARAVVQELKRHRGR